MYCSQILNRTHDRLPLKAPAHSKVQYMFQYFVKVVGTEFHSLNPFPTHLNAQEMPQYDRMQINSHQYSVTSFLRDVGQKAHVTNDEGIEMTHGLDAMPGVPVRQFKAPFTDMHNQDYL